MKHPATLVLPVLMLADYFLTVVGARMREGTYNDHYKHEHYELNPINQKHIQQKKWLSGRHLTATVLFTAVVTLEMEYGGLPGALIDGMLGALFVLYGMLIGRQLSNILIFRTMDQRPGEVSGQVTVSHAMQLSISSSQYLVAAVPIAIMAVFRPTPFVLGGLGGAGLIFLIHLKWIRRHKRRLEGSGR